jgi:adenine/guanine phosphoribosyltransferase-like PRPP-binding protein
MDSIVVDIRIGTPGPQRLSERRISFQDQAVKMFFPNEKINRLGHMHSFDFSYGKLDSDASYIEEILNIACQPFYSETEAATRALIIDFTESPFDLVRDPILLHLASKLDALFKAKVCSHAVLLLPFTHLPAKDCLLFSRLEKIQDEAHGCEVHILVRDGSFKRLPDGTVEILTDYVSLLQAQQADPLDQLKKKMVRRIGRFKSSSHGDKTRVFSYLIDNCEEELLLLMQKWWQQNHIQCDALVYDTVNIPSMTDAVRAFAEKIKIPYLPLSSITQDPNLLRDVKEPKQCFLILDVVETGQTLLRHSEAIESQGCSVYKNVLAVISRGGGLERQVGKFSVTSFTHVDLDPDFPIKMQDALELPYSSHSLEALEVLRSFDMWFMAHEAGWGPETDVPETGYGYKLVPVFTRILEMFGDWIAYKMDKALQNRYIPQDVFIIHPDETGASSVSDKLRTRLDPKLLIVRVPRIYIHEAQKQSNDWSKVLGLVRKDEEWFDLLGKMRDASAIITDIFNASGGTFQTMYALLNYYGIPCAGYFPFVDRDDFIQKPEKYPVQRFCLYSWFGPRKKKIIGGALNA